MIGNRDDAALALSGNVPVWNADGTTRTCYLINGVVYKIADSPFDNEMEYENYLTFIENPVHPLIAFPETAIYHISGEPVIAMEYIDGQHIGECYCHLTGEACTEMCMSPEMCRVFDTFTNDNSGLNIILRDGIYYMIDMVS